MRDNEALYTNFIEDDVTFDEYCDFMLDDGVWAD